MSVNRWMCDKCLGEILEPEHGCVEWLVRVEGDTRVGRGLRLVHINQQSPQAVDDWGCQYNQATEGKRDGSAVNDASLSTCLGSGGLMYLLCMLEEGELPVEDMVEMIGRLHVDGYEQERMRSR
ncbi:MAG: hypothetical protein WCK89_14870 [bacterium]